MFYFVQLPKLFTVGNLPTVNWHFPTVEVSYFVQLPNGRNGRKLLKGHGSMVCTWSPVSDPPFYATSCTRVGISLPKINETGESK